MLKGILAQDFDDIFLCGSRPTVEIGFSQPFLKNFGFSG